MSYSRRQALLIILLSCEIIMGVPLGPLRALSWKLQETFHWLALDLEMQPITSDMSALQAGSQNSSYERTPVVEIFDTLAQLAHILS